MSPDGARLSRHRYAVRIPQRRSAHDDQLTKRSSTPIVSLEAVEVAGPFARPIAVKALPNFRIWLRYDDGTDGEIDLSDLAGLGVFEAWDDVAFFNAVRLSSHGAIEWGSDIDICPDALYLRLTGKSPEEIFPNLRSVHADA